MRNQPRWTNPTFLLAIVAIAFVMSGCARSLYQIRQSQAGADTPNSALPQGEAGKEIPEQETALSAQEAGGNEVPPSSPCHPYHDPSSDTYCYRWVEDGLVSMAQYLIVYPQSEGIVIAQTPLGAAQGRWDGPGNVILETPEGRQISCDGKERASEVLGRKSPEGFCRETS